MPSSSNSLALLDQAHHLLSQATTLEDLKEVRDVSEAARTYAKAAQLGLCLQNRAAELKLRAERKAGALLGQLSLKGGDRRSKSHDATLKLAELGLSKDQSARWQLAATVPDAEFERFIRGACEIGQEMTAAGLLRLARARQERSPVRRRAKQRGAASNSSAVGRPELLSLLDEAGHQGELLASLLEPVCNGKLPGLETAERRYIARLLRDIRQSIAELRTQLWTAE